jgi:acetylornithine deacetylase/succinyl-diaminopimelate desuccinylase-like protein
LASELKPLPLPLARRPSSVRRIAQLAEQEPLAAAQRWFARERSWINDIHLRLCRIPAATFFEHERAEWLQARLSTLGWQARLDRAGNVLATFAGAEFPSLVVSAHIDTVFAPARPEDVFLMSDGRLAGPGVSDNGSGLSALLALARLLAEDRHLHSLASAILLVANVGEEGEGNLSGMRYLCRAEPGRHALDLGKIKAFVVLDGPSVEHITAQALASRRFEIIFAGPGGHSWNDYGTPNPVHAMADLVSHFVQTAETRLAADRSLRCSYNFGVMDGGTSINSIPSTARAKLDVRCAEIPILDELNRLLSASVERSLERENKSSRGRRLSAKIKELGSRPGGKLAEESALLRIIQSVDAYLDIRSRVDCSSTDANVPLSLGLPAISIGVGGQGGGAHTPDEWYQPEGRELGLRRILLLLASIHSEVSQLSDSLQDSPQG